MRGVRIRSTTGSSAVLSSSDQLAGGRRAPPARRARRRRRRGSGPSPRTTTQNGSPPAVACAAICVASSRCGSPATEKTGSFWPRTRVVRRVDGRDAGEHRLGAAARAQAGLSGWPATARGRSPEHRRAAVERLAAAVADPAEPAVADRDAAAARRRTRRAVAAGIDARRCPPAPGPPPGRGRPRAPGRGATSPAASRIGANSSQPTPVDAADHEQRAAQLESTPVYSIRAPLIASASSAVEQLGSRHAPRRRPRRRGRPPRAPGQRREVELLDAPPPGTPRVDEVARSGRCTSSTSVDERRRLRRASSTRRCATERALLQHRLAQQPAGEQHHALAAGQRAGADQLGQRAAAGRPRRAARRSRAAPRAPSRDRRCAACQAAERVGVAGRTTRPAHRRVVPGVGEVAVERPQRSGRSAGCAR